MNRVNQTPGSNVHGTLGSSKQSDIASATSGSLQMLKLPPELEKIISSLSQTKDVTDAFKILNQCSESRLIKQLEPSNTFKLKEFKIEVILKDQCDVISQNLSIANSIGVKCAPTLVKNIPIDDFSVLVTHYEGCEEQFPTPYDSSSRFTNNPHLEIFFDDIRKLAEQGYIHEYGSMGTDHWEVVPQTGRVMLNSWFTLTKSDVQDPMKIVKEFRSQL